MKIRFLLVTLLLVLVFTGTVFAQGVQTAILEGTVTGPDGKALPGVTVSVKSPALMGERQTVTSTTGDYNIPGLPPGDYTVNFSLEGMQSTTKKMNLVLGLPSRMDAQMKVTAVAEAITVTAASPAVLENQTVGANIKSETVQQLPILRTPTDIGALSTYTSIWRYESFGDRETRRGKLQADERWQGFLARIQPLIHTQHNRILVPTSFSPLR